MTLNNSKNKTIVKIINEHVNMDRICLECNKIVGSSLGQVKPKTIKLVFVVSFVKHTALKCNSKDGLAQNRIICQEWIDMSAHELLVL